MASSSRKSISARNEEDPDEITVECEGIDISCDRNDRPTTVGNVTGKTASERKSPSLRKKLGLKLNLSSRSSSPKKEKRSKPQQRESHGETLTGFTPKPRRKNKFWLFGFKSKSQSKDESSGHQQATECCSPCTRSRSFRERLRRRTSRENEINNDYTHITSAGSRHGHLEGPGVVFTSNRKPRTPMIDLDSFNPDDYPITDVDEKMREVRAREMEEGVPMDMPSAKTDRSNISTPVSPTERNPTTDAMNDQLDQLESSLADGIVFGKRVQKVSCPEPIPRSNSGNVVSDSSVHMVGQYGCLTPNGSYAPRTVHTQIDYIHCLVPDLTSIANSSFYWGKMDRYEAEKQLESKPEGTFLLRDSAQEEFLFSVSFRRYGRSLHARIEQWNHKFSFDAHDPGVFSADTVCGLLEHYKDPNFCMFFEPMLTIPLPRPNPVSLQHLCRAVICGHIRYDDIKQLLLPSSLREYLREYHYKQKVRVRRFEIDGPTEREVL
ncbi:suppressor of cytokine signaling 5-like [Ptychodera flava]|uniref:suppressor of cytokine signaling 5-like n=1 Tax=Ptychodera flava TaxID=63121 RepID=UPI003969E0C2